MTSAKRIAQVVLLVLLLPAVATSAMWVSGRVFVDGNCNGSFDADETGLACVPISDGVSFVETDGDGRYTIAAQLDPLVNCKQWPILTVHFPTGYWPVCGHFRRVAEQPDPGNVDFPLRPDAQCLPFTFIHASDPHVPRRGREKFENFRREVEQLAGPVKFCILTGDLVDGAKRRNLDDACQLYNLLARQTCDFPVPLFMIPGNVDHAGTNVLRREKCSPLYGYGLYWQVVGPLRWSFDYAGVHFVGIDFMHRRPRCVDLRSRHSECSRCGSRWKNGVPASAVEWLRQDLMRVRPGSRIFLFVHHPIGSKAFQHVLKRYCVTHIFAGHHHQDKHKQYAGIPVTISGSVSRIYLQVMGIPTLGPFCRAYANVLGLTQGMPLRAHLSLVYRAHWMIDNMERDIANSMGSVALVHDPYELDHNTQCGILSVMFAIEGGQILRGNQRNLDCYFNRGVRMIGMAHFQPNNLGGATYRRWDRRRGLTPIGRQVVCRANDLGMIVDMAHASEPAIREILAISRAPVIFSHTGVDGVTPKPRNISDEAICGVARSGGVIGIIFHRGFVGGPSVDDVVNHIMYVVNLVGPEYVAYGSDFAGGIRLPRGVKDVSDLPLITAALMKRGLSECDLRLILGENFRRVFHEVWEARLME